MMSLVKVNFRALIKNQVRFKIRSNSNMVVSLAMIQLIGVLFSLNGVAQMGNNIITINYYSADLVIIFTLIWAFLTGITFTTKSLREEDLVYIGNRLSSGIANVIYFIMVSVIGGITALMTSPVIHVVNYYFFNTKSFISLQPSVPLSAYIYGTVATILYVLLFISLGYLIGSLVQKYKIFIWILPIVIIGLGIVLSLKEKHIVNILGEFYFEETSILFLTFKIVMTVFAMLALSIFISNRQEVRI